MSSPSMLWSSSLLLLISGATGASGVAETCIEQFPCLNINHELNEKDEFESYTICMSWNEDNPQCMKSKSESEGDVNAMSHSCFLKKGSDGELASVFLWQWQANDEMCVTVPCGERAMFGVKDGSGCHASKSLSNLEIGGLADIECRFNSDAPHCMYNGQSNAECEWSIPAPRCRSDGEEMAELVPEANEQRPNRKLLGKRGGKKGKGKSKSKSKSKGKGKGKGKGGGRGPSPTPRPTQTPQPTTPQPTRTPEPSSSGALPTYEPVATPWPTYEPVATPWPSYEPTEQSAAAIAVPENNAFNVEPVDTVPVPASAPKKTGLGDQMVHWIREWSLWIFVLCVVIIVADLCFFCRKCCFGEEKAFSAMSYGFEDSNVNKNLDL